MISKNIRELRLQNKLTQPQLAEKIGVKRSTISAWEHDNGTPSPEMLSKLKDALNCSYEELIDGKL